MAKYQDRETKTKISFQIFKTAFGIDIYEYKKVHFASILARYIKKNTLLLDAGCGKRQGWLQKNRVGKAFGLDIDYESLKMNNFYDLKICGDLENLPIRPKYFDTIISIYILEHLRRPINVFKEFNRVLKNSGILILIVPNKYSLVGFFASFLPAKIQKFLWLKLKKTKQPHKVYYRANTFWKIRELGSKNTFLLKEFQAIEGPPLWFATTPIFFKIILYYQKIMNRFNSLKYLRNSMGFVFQKQESIQV